MASIPYGQNVFITPDYRQLVIVLPRTSEQTQSINQTVFRLSLHNAVEPNVTVSISTQKDTPELVYRYTVSNAKRARDPIGYFGIVAPLMQAGPSLTQNQGNTERGKWVGTSAFALVAAQAELPKQPNGRYLYWLAEGDQYGIAPGELLNGFELKSTYGPGFTTAYLSSRDLLSVPQDWPSDVYKQLNILNEPKWVKQVALTLGPMFPPNRRPREIAVNFTEGVKVLVASKKIDRDAAWLHEFETLMNEVEAEKSSDYLAAGFTRLRREATPGIEMELTDALKLSLKISVPNSR